MNNRPVWQSCADTKPKCLVSHADDGFSIDTERKKGRLWVYVSPLFTTPESGMIPPIPMDVDNGLPGIEMWLGRNEVTEVGLRMNLDSCTTMNTDNLRVHQWLTTAHPHLVAEYIQFDESNPFKPPQLWCTVQDYESVLATHGRMTVYYWMRYKTNDAVITLSFGLGANVYVNFIEGLPTLCRCGGVLNFADSIFLAPALEKHFPLHYEPTKQGLPHSVQFDAKSFIRPPPR